MISRLRIVPFNLLLVVSVGAETEAVSRPAQGVALRVLPLEIEGGPKDRRVTLSGQWQGEQEGLSSITRINAVTLSCDQQAMKCHESIAMVTSPADGLPTSGALYAVQFEYDVRKWGPVIEAAGATRAANLTLIIDLEQRVVRRTMAETTERGAKTSNPSTERWVLK